MILYKVADLPHLLPEMDTAETCQPVRQGVPVGLMNSVPCKIGLDATFLS